jgi:ribulose-phosphate 3-epimerase
MLKCSASLWSADLARLADEMKRVEPYCERYHFDVADGHYVRSLLFFPDLVRALRAHTSLPFEVHAMVTDPVAWIDAFAEAGANSIIFCFDAVEDPGVTINAIRSRGLQAGVSLLLPEPVELLDPYWTDLDLVTICGTDMGIKGASMDPSVPAKIAEAKSIVARRHLRTEVEADGGIRRETVPQLHAAGADFIVPGSLMFREDPKEMRAWLASL